MAKIRSTIFLTIGLSLVLLGTVAAQEHDRDAGEFVILNAQYGNEYHHVDVTHRLGELARHDVTFRVEYNTIDADPAPGQAKMLRVIARGPNGRERIFDFPDGSIFSGAQFRGWGRGDWGEENWSGGWNGRVAENDHDGDHRDGREDRADRPEHREHHDAGEFLILSAQYGTEFHHVDVTRQLRELARQNQTFQMDNHTFGIDPHYGHHKVLRIYARGPEGRERMFEFPEHSWVDGSQFRGWGSGEWSRDDDHWSGRWNGEEHGHGEEHDRH